jgi:serine/threonine protein kinase
MSLIDGAPLNEFIASMKEKGDCFSEDRILNIFSQLIRALRYLHEDKKIVHRDLKPANMILGEQDKLTITDFGLAKHYKDLSLMKSTVGTMIYWCPELVENKEYDKKADIWAAGCILYEMCTLQPPFYATNMLLLAKKIAEVQFDKSLVGGYSNLLQSVICSCLTVNPSARPDSHQIGSMLAEHLMKQLDDTLNDCALLENKITTERNRALKYLLIPL